MLILFPYCIPNLTLLIFWIYKMNSNISNNYIFIIDPNLKPSIHNIEKQGAIFNKCFNIIDGFWFEGLKLHT